MSEQNVMEGSPDFAGESFGGDFGDDQFTGDTESDSAADGQPGPGMGQSKSSRRRRRKRKKTSTPGDATAGSAPGADPSVPVPIVMEGERLALAASAGAPAPRRQSNGFQGGQNGSQQQGQGQGKRWKKKFRDRDRRPAPGGSPGNEFRPEAAPASLNGNDRPHSSDRPFNGDRQYSNNGGGGGSYDRPYRREGGGRPDNFGNLVSHQGRKKQGGGGGRERGFVGPMDHSYREMNSEFGEAPPSTIQLRGRHGRRHFGDNQPIDHNAPRPVPIPEGAQTHIYMFVEDLFIIAKVQETAKKLGVKVAFIKNEKEAIAELTNGEDLNKPALIVFDLNNANAKPLTLIPKLKAKLKRATSIIGFLSMIQGDLKAKAVEAGCDTVMPRAAFSQNLPNLLRRYGVEETEEINFNY